MVLFPFDPATHPPNHPPAGKVSIETGDESNKKELIQDHLVTTLSMQHLSIQDLSVQHLSMQHLSMQHFSIQHLSRDKIRLFTIATTPVWTKQSNFKLATEPNQNLANPS